MPRPNRRPPFMQPGYKPSPQKPKYYNVNGAPKVPTAYNPDWQHFTDLTPDQVAWYMAQPEWINYLAYIALSPTTATIGVPPEVVSAALQTAGQPIATVPLPSPLQPLGKL